MQAVAGCGCETARHSACLKQATTSRQGQNLQGRWAAGWVQLNAVEVAPSSNHQQEQDESDVEAEEDEWDSQDGLPAFRGWPIDEGATEPSSQATESLISANQG